MPRRVCEGACVKMRTIAGSSAIKLCTAISLLYLFSFRLFPVPFGSPPAQHNSAHLRVRRAFLYRPHDLVLSKRAEVMQI